MNLREQRMAEFLDVAAGEKPLDGTNIKLESYDRVRTQRLDEKTKFVIARLSNINEDAFEMGREMAMTYSNDELSYFTRRMCEGWQYQRQLKNEEDKELEGLGMLIEKTIVKKDEER
jgi:hypothetical protein